MNIYKPFTTLFCTIESFYKLTGGGGIYHSVSGLIASLQWLNIIAIGSFYSEIMEVEMKFSFYTLMYIITLTINIVYFKKVKCKVLLSKYESLEREVKIINGIYSVIYIIASCAIFYIGLNLK